VNRACIKEDHAQFQQYLHRASEGGEITSRNYLSRSNQIETHMKVLIAKGHENFSAKVRLWLLKIITKHLLSI
jgi:hypothetical protein